MLQPDGCEEHQPAVDHPAAQLAPGRVTPTLPRPKEARCPPRSCRGRHRRSCHADHADGRLRTDDRLCAHHDGVSAALVLGQLDAHPCGVRVPRPLVRTRGLALLTAAHQRNWPWRASPRPLACFVPRCFARTLELVLSACLCFLLSFFPSIFVFCLGVCSFAVVWSGCYAQCLCCFDPKPHHVCNVRKKRNE